MKIKLMCVEVPNCCLAEKNKANQKYFDYPVFWGDSLYLFEYHPNQLIFESERGSSGTTADINWDYPKQTRIYDSI